MEDKKMEEELTYSILLGERVSLAVDEADSFKSECNNLRCHVDTLIDMLRVLIRFISSVQSFYDRPARRVISEVRKNLEKALTLVRKCKRRSIFHRVVNIITAADFRKVQNVVEASVGDVKWLKSVIECNEGGLVLTLPPIASNDPILAWVWSSITSLYMSVLSDKIEAANELASLAKDNDRNKQIIVEEAGVLPLLKLLKESGSVEAQIAGANALYFLANDRDRVRAIIDALGVPVIVKALTDSPMMVQSLLASLIASMAKHDPLAQDDFARENVIRPLVTLLAFETFSDDQMAMQLGKQHIHSIAQINKEIEKNTLSGSGKNSGDNFRPYVNSFSSFHSEGSSRGGNKKERENEKAEIKHKLKISCAEAMWMLARGSISNSKRITETKGLLCLAKLVEKEEGELQFNCLKTIEEITTAAESNADLRRAAFKTNSPVAKAVVDQLLRLMIESDSPTLQIPAIRSIGSLARTFPARETRVIAPVVAQLSNRNFDVGMEATIALGKFACPQNFLCEAHSKTITEHNAFAPLMRLLRGNEKGQFHALFLLCYLALHAGNNEALDQPRLLTALEGTDKTVIAHHPELRELVTKAIYHISLYHPGHHSLSFSSTLSM